VRDLHLPLDPAAGKLPAQIAAGVRAAVREGRLAAGARLPSTRALARRLGVSRGVVVAAPAGLPGVAVRGVAAGLHVYAELPASCDEEKVVTEASHRGLLLQGAAPMWSRPAKPALVLGYGRVNEARLRSAVDILKQVIAPGGGG